MNNTDVKEIVKEKYGEIASKNQSSCGCGCGSTKNKIVDYTIMNDEYKNVEGYVPDADLNLGCGMPTEFAAIKEGDTVVDLGSGAGNDVFVAYRQRVELLTNIMSTSATADEAWRRICKVYDLKP